MIVTCPSCSARYRVPEERIQGKGARITCPSCSHKFVVYRGDEKVVLGAEADAARGVPVSISKAGQVRRAATIDDEDEQPTSLMPRGSSVPVERPAGMAAPKGLEGLPVAPASSNAPVSASNTPPTPEPPASAARATRGGGTREVPAPRGRAQAAPAEAPAQGASNVQFILLAAVVVVVAAVASMYLL